MAQYLIVECEEVLLHCLQFTINDIAESGVIAQVCKSWQRGVKHHTAWANAIFTLPNQSVNFMLSKILNFYEKSLEELKCIKYFCGSNIYDVELSPVLFSQLCSRTAVNRLEIVRRRFDDSWWSDFSMNSGDYVIASLTYINLSGCSQLTDATFKLLAKYTKLKNIYLSGTNVSDDSIEVLSALPDLRELGLSCSQVSSLPGVGNVSATLEYLNVNGCVINHSTVEQIAKLVNLKSLSLSQKTAIPPQLSPLLFSCKKLLSLDLVGFSNHSFPSDIILASLEKLYLTNSGVSLLPSCPNLKVLCLSGCMFLATQAITSLSSCPNLAILSIDGSPQIALTAIETLSSSFSLGKPPQGLYTYQWSNMDSGGQLWWTLDGK